LPDPHYNFAYSTVVTAPSPNPDVDTTLVVATLEGQLFPAPCNVTIWPAGAQPSYTTGAEIARLTSVVGDTLTITRAQENTNARFILVGDQIAATITAKTLTDAESLGAVLLVPTDDVYLAANSSVTPVEEYVMDATHELVFGDLSEMAVIL
jgi:hypothetical protein